MGRLRVTGYGFVKNDGLGYDCGLRLWATVSGDTEIVGFDCGLRFQATVSATHVGYDCGLRLWATVVGYNCA